jgi:hypothetical protein
VVGELYDRRSFGLELRSRTNSLPLLAFFF